MDTLKTDYTDFFLEVLLKTMESNRPQDVVQLLRIFNAFTKGLELRSTSDGEELIGVEDDLILSPAQDLLGKSLPYHFAYLYRDLQGRFSEENNGKPNQPSQEFLTKVYPAFLRLLLPLGQVIMNNGGMPLPIGFLKPVYDLARSLGIRSMCDMSTNSISRGTAISSLLAWSVYENNRHDTPENYVLYDAIVDYDFLHWGCSPCLVAILDSASLRADKYALLVSELTEPHPDYFDGGKLVAVKVLSKNQFKHNYFILAFDLRVGGHDSFEAPDGSIVPYSQILEKDGRFDF